MNGVEVRRFPSVSERDLDAFNVLSEPLYRGPRSHDDEIEWLRRQGPEVPALVEALAAEADRFHAVVFFTYLYYPTYWGLKAAPRRSVLVPTTHDEPPLRFSIYDEMFARPRAFAFLTAPEEALVRSRFEIGGRPAAVAGIGIDMPGPADTAGFRAATFPGRALRAVRGADRRRKRVRGDDLALRRLSRGRRPRGPRPHRRPGHGAAARSRAAVPGVPVRRGQAGRDGRRARRGVLQPLREPLHRAAGGVRGRRARPGERALRRAQGPLPARERGPVLRRTRTSSRPPSTCSSPTTRSAAAWGGAAAATST